MHILIVAPERFPLPGSGSVEICILSIAKQLANDHRVTIICKQTPTQQKLSQSGKVKIVRIPAGSRAEYIKSVLRYIEGKHFDLIQIDNRPHYIAPIKQAFPRIPLSLFLHSLTFVPQTAAVAHSFKKADVIIANSHSLKSKLSQRFAHERNKIKTVHLGVDSSRFRPASESRKMRSQFVIMFAGRLIPRKGIPLLIKAVSEVRRKVKDVKLIIVGQGSQSYARQLKLAAHKLNVAASFVGKVDHAKIHFYFQVADCFVCPSQQHESFGLVNVEAMAAGVPVIASRIGGIKEIIQHGSNGYLVSDYRHPKSFARYIIAIANDRNRAKHMSKLARKSVISRFTWRHTAQNLNQIYRRLLGL